MNLKFTCDRFCLSFLTGFSGIPFANDHYKASKTPHLSMSVIWKHRLLMTLEALPLVGLIIALIEKLFSKKHPHHVARVKNTKSLKSKKIVKQKSKLPNHTLPLTHSHSVPKPFTPAPFTPKLLTAKSIKATPVKLSSPTTPSLSRPIPLTTTDRDAAISHLQAPGVTVTNTAHGVCVSSSITF